MKRSYRLIAAAAVCSLASTSQAFAPPSSSSAASSPLVSSKSSAARYSPQWLPKKPTATATTNKPSSSISQSMLPASTLLATEELSADSSLLYTILHTPTLWSVLAMTSIVALLVLWEETIHNIRSSTPKPILPVIDSMLAEVGGLG